MNSSLDSAIWSEMSKHVDLANFPWSRHNPPTLGLGTAVGHPKDLPCHKDVALIPAARGEMAN